MIKIEEAQGFLVEGMFYKTKPEAVKQSFTIDMHRLLARIIAQHSERAKMIEALISNDKEIIDKTMEFYAVINDLTYTPCNVTGDVDGIFKSMIPCPNCGASNV